MNTVKVVTIGLGYIGLPTSALIAQHGIQVHGVDIDQKVVDTVNRGEIHIVEPSLDIAVAAAVKKDFLKAALTPVAAETYLIVVPTPFKGNHEPDISYVLSATKKIIPLLKEGDLYIIESTSPVGTTEKMMQYIYGERPELTDKLHIAYCPERVLPGNVMHELVYNDRVIGGVDERATQKAMQFYQQFVKGALHATNARTAEMCKLTENSSRDVQIAFANELSLICDKAGINVWELIKLANKHPRVDILEPGPGVGGHCIAVDPWFIVSRHKEDAKLIQVAREVNENKKEWVVNKIQERINNFSDTFKKEPICACYGLSYKPNIEDCRESPALDIVRELMKNNNNIIAVDPYVLKQDNIIIKDMDFAQSAADIHIYLVKHKDFEKIDFSNMSKNSELLDYCKILG